MSVTKPKASSAKWVTDSTGRNVLVLDAAASRDINRLWAADTPDFAQLAKTAGLDPATDFIGKDLSNLPIGFGKPNLKSFNFTKADLRGTGLSSAQLDGSVILIGAKLDPHDRKHATQSGARFKPLSAVEKERRTLTLATQADVNDPWPWFALGDFEVRVGYLPAALEAYHLAYKAAVKTGNQRDLSVYHNKIGNLQVLQGKLTEALTSFNASLIIAERLTKADPANNEWQRDLSASHIKIGTVQVSQGEHLEALTSFNASFDIVERFAIADPDNSEWQRDISILRIKIGDILVSIGKLTDALTSFNASLIKAERLAKADPTNSTWQHDLSVSHNKIGDVQFLQGKLTEALTNFTTGLSITKRLAKADPPNSQWQHDLILSYFKIAKCNLQSAPNYYQMALAVAEKLDREGKLNQAETPKLEDLKQHLAASKLVKS